MTAAGSASVPLVVTGAAGRIGRFLRAHWGAAVPGFATQWWSRATGPDLAGEGPMPLPQGAVILHLAAATRGDEVALAANPRMAAALGAASRAAGARHVLFASTAAVYAPGPAALSETAPSPGANAYGRSKLAAEVALRAALAGSATGLTCLRIGNVAGADALLGGTRGADEIVLDPVGQGGPRRTYIAPDVLAAVLLHLCRQAATGVDLPDVLNIGQAPALDMADLLAATGRAWRFGPPRDGAVPVVELDLALLRQMADLPPATAVAMVRAAGQIVP